MGNNSSKINDLYFVLYEFNIFYVNIYNQSEDFPLDIKYNEDKVSYEISLKNNNYFELYGLNQTYNFSSNLKEIEEWSNKFFNAVK